MEQSKAFNVFSRLLCILNWEPPFLPLVVTMFPGKGFLCQLEGRYGYACAGMRRTNAISEAIDREFLLSP